MRTDSRELLAVGIFGSRSRIGERVETMLRRGRTFSPRVSTAGITASAVALSTLLFAGSLTPRWIAFAQQSTRLEFEVVSIKPGAPEERRMFIGPGPGGGISVTNMTLKQMIQRAWHIVPLQISGGPAWIDSARYNVVARPEKKPTPEENMRMLQALLKDRFQLAIHSETKEMPVYALVPTRKDGKLGENLTESKEGGCTAPDPTQLPPLIRGEKLGCGGAIQSRRFMNGVSVPMTELARSLSLLVGRWVIDKTGLTAKYDYTVEFTADEGVALPGALPVDSSKPTLFTALQEQLGLKLESQKGPVEVFVVDHAEKPDAN